MEDHSKRAHAILSASKAERWLHCTPSARLEDKMPDETTSAYAQEGTLAHELGELMLQLEVREAISEDEYVDRLSVIMSSLLFKDEMMLEVPKYVDYVKERIEEIRASGIEPTILIEERLDLSRYIPEAFGLCDTVIISDGVLEVIDLKYGKGVRVSATANKQLMVYGIGALDKYAMAYNIDTIALTVMQPRMDNISTWSIGASELIDWAEGELTEKANTAFAGTGDLTPGSWCKFCKVKARCPALSMQSTAVLDFANSALEITGTKKIELLSDDNIAELLLRIPAMLDWAKGIQEYAYNMAVNYQKVWPGFKLVEGTSRRKWLDEAEAAKIIKKHFPACEDDDLYNTSLKGITEIEKLITKKKFNELLSEVVIKAPGNLTLVPDTDKRQAVGLSQAKSDFSQ